MPHTQAFAAAAEVALGSREGVGTRTVFSGTAKQPWGPHCPGDPHLPKLLLCWAAEQELPPISP